MYEVKERSGSNRSFYFTDFKDAVNFFYRLKKIFKMKKPVITYGKKGWENIQKKEISDKSLPVFTETKKFRFFLIDRVFCNIDYTDEEITEMLGDTDE